MATSTYTPLYTTTLSSSQTTITFSSIPSGYTDLVLATSIKYTTSGDYSKLTFNGDTTSGYYSSTLMIGNGSTATSSRTTAVNFIGVNYDANTEFSADTFQIQSYANSNVYKTVLNRHSVAGTRAEALVGLWRNTNAITSITLTAATGYAAGSIFSLYGIAAAPSAKATGGMITSDATYYYHTFLSSGTFTPTQSLSAAILVVGGGGGSGYGNNAGSGGAGGYLEGTGIALTATAYTVTVGGGGTTSWPSAGDGTAGVDSSFGSIGTAFGGGRGSGTTSRNGGNGGSGGGGGYDGSSYGTGGTATQTSQNGLTGFGNNGGGGVSVAGGGGAGGAASGTTGGAGKTSSLMGGTYAVGATGGGVGPNVTPTQNTGNSGPQGSAGGSGIVIVRYAK